MKKLQSNICPECKEPKLFLVKKALTYYSLSKDGSIRPITETELLEEVLLCENLCEVPQK